MISLAKKLALGSIDSSRAIIEGEFFSTSLQNQLSTLEALSSVLRRLEVLEGCEAASRERISTIITHLENIAPALTPNRWAEDSDAGQNAPEERIIEFLLPRLKSQTILDVGAHRGNFTSAMLEIGCNSVYAFEPHPELAKTLAKTFESDRRVTILPVALSSDDGSAQLNLVRAQADSQLDADPLLFSALSPHNMPKGLEFHGSVEVEMRSLRSLSAEGMIPQNAGLLKVDAEGHDLMVFKGMPQGAPYEMLMSEFWSDDFVFASPNIPRHSEIRTYLREVGYGHSISIIRKAGSRIAFVANRMVPISRTWGNTFYFRDLSAFDAAYGFAKSVLPQAF